jgi:tetratricopeptide (TPR) repeat protein
MKRIFTFLLISLLFTGIVYATIFDDALKAVAAGNDAAALPLFEKALAAEPDNLKIHDAYRKAVIRTGGYEQALGFYEKLTAAHPGSASAWLNYGYAYVDKIPAAGSVTQVILANKALTHFSKSIELKKTWIALYTRGNSYLYWPKVFGRAPLGVADLEQAVAMAKQEATKKKVYVRSWIALGDGYWKTGEPGKAKAAWREGVQLFGSDPQLEARLSRDGEELEKYLYEQLDPNKRVDTSLVPLWEGE